MSINFEPCNQMQASTLANQTYNNNKSSFIARSGKHKNSGLNLTMLTLALCSTMISGCQLNSDFFSGLNKYDELNNAQDIENRKLLLAHAYDHMVPELNRYYPINRTTYGLIKDTKEHDQGSYALLSYEILAKTLQQQGSALCVVKDNCPFDTTYLNTIVSTIKEDDMGDSVLISLDTEALSLSQLYNEKGYALSSLAVNSSIAPKYAPFKRNKTPSYVKANSYEQAQAMLSSTNKHSKHKAHAQEQAQAKPLVKPSTKTQAYASDKSSTQALPYAQSQAKSHGQLKVQTYGQGKATSYNQAISQDNSQSQSAGLDKLSEHGTDKTQSSSISPLASNNMQGAQASLDSSVTLKAKDQTNAKSVKLSSISSETNANLHPQDEAMKALVAPLSALNKPSAQNNKLSPVEPRAQQEPSTEPKAPIALTQTVPHGSDMSKALSPTLPLASGHSTPLASGPTMSKLHGPAMPVESGLAKDEAPSLANDYGMKKSSTKHESAADMSLAQNKVKPKYKSVFVPDNPYEFNYEQELKDIIDLKLDVKTLTIKQDKHSAKDDKQDLSLNRIDTKANDITKEQPVLHSSYNASTKTGYGQPQAKIMTNNQAQALAQDSGMTSNSLFSTVALVDNDEPMLFASSNNHFGQDQIIAHEANSMTLKRPHSDFEDQGSIILIFDDNVQSLFKGIDQAQELSTLSLDCLQAQVVLDSNYTLGGL